MESTRTNPSEIGLALSYIIAIQMGFTFAVRQLAEVENDMNSVERLMYYGRELEQEAAYEIASTAPPKEWPQRGEIIFQDVKLRYRPGLPLVLDGLSFSVNAAEKVAVVGRTGAGKSSLMQAIFRIVELDAGSIVIDDLNIASLGLAPLRKGVAIIPQDALLFSGSKSNRSHIWGRKLISDVQPYEATSIPLANAMTMLCGMLYAELI